MSSFFPRCDAWLQEYQNSSCSSRLLYRKQTKSRTPCGDAATTACFQGRPCPYTYQSCADNRKELLDCPKYEFHGCRRLDRDFMNSTFSMSVLEQAMASIRAIPASIHLPAAVAVVAGLVLLLAGCRVFRPVYLLAGSAIGALLGALLLPNFTPDYLGGVPSPVWGLGIGSILGGLVSLALYRLAMGVTSAVSTALLATLCAMAYLTTIPGAVPQTTNTQRLLDSWEAGAREAGVSLAKTEVSRVTSKIKGVSGDTSDPALDSAAATTRAFVDSLFHEGRNYWSGLPGDSRVTLIASLIGGALLGFVLGIAAPRKGAAIVTSLLGAGLLVSGTAWLMAGLDIPGRSLLSRGATVWLGAWLLPAAAGMVFQMTRPGGGACRAGTAPAAA